MKLTDLEPCVLSFRKHPNLGIAFNCPGDCCAERRDLQARAAELEAINDPGAPAARHAAFKSQPFRVWIAFKGRAVLGEQEPSGHTIDQLFTSDGFDFVALSIAEEVDRTKYGHARLRVKNGAVILLT